MAFGTRRKLEMLHFKTGEVLRLCNRVLATMIFLGTVFSALVVVSVQVLNHPERILHTQAFMFNYGEFSHQGVPLADTTANTAVAPHTSTAKSDLQDPNWDGMLAGAGLGVTMGQQVPFIGGFIGPVLGAFIGYRLDERI